MKLVGDRSLILLGALFCLIISVAIDEAAAVEDVKEPDITHFDESIKKQLRVIINHFRKAYNVMSKANAVIGLIDTNTEIVQLWKHSIFEDITGCWNKLITEINELNLRMQHDKSTGSNALALLKNRYKEEITNMMHIRKWIYPGNGFILLNVKSGSLALLCECSEDGSIRGIEQFQMKYEDELNGADKEAFVAILKNAKEQLLSDVNSENVCFSFTSESERNYQYTIAKMIIIANFWTYKAVMDADALNRPGLYVAHRIIMAILDFDAEGYAKHHHQSAVGNIKVKDFGQQSEVHKSIEIVIKEAAAASLAAFTSIGIEDSTRALLKICESEILKETKETILKYLLRTGDEARRHRTRFLHGYLEYRLHLEVERNVGLKKDGSSESMGNEGNGSLLEKVETPNHMFQSFGLPPDVRK